MCQRLGAFLYYTPPIVAARRDIIRNICQLASRNSRKWSVLQKVTLQSDNMRHMSIIKEVVDEICDLKKRINILSVVRTMRH